MSFSLLIFYHIGELKQLMEGINMLCSHNISTGAEEKGDGTGRGTRLPLFGYSKLLIHAILSHEILAQEESYDNYPNSSEV